MYGTGARGSYYNPVTGNSGYAAHGAKLQRLHRQLHHRHARERLQPDHRQSLRRRGRTVSNAYTGNYAAGARGMDYNQNTGVVQRRSCRGRWATPIPASPWPERTALPTTPIPATASRTTRTTPTPTHDGNVYKYNPSSGWQQHSGSGWSHPSSGFDKSSMDNWAASRSQGAQRWGNFSSGGWGGASGGGGWADRGGWGGGGRSFGGGGFGRR